MLPMDCAVNQPLAGFENLANGVGRFIITQYLTILSRKACTFFVSLGNLPANDLESDGWMGVIYRRLDERCTTWFGVVREAICPNGKTNDDKILKSTRVGALFLSS